MITIYHNARCRKSREGLEILQNSGKMFHVREYLKNPLTKAEIKNLLKKLDVLPIQLVRTGESIWKENYQNRDLSDEELIEILAENPKLIERPIVENGKTAVIGRPPSMIEKIL